MKYALQQTKKKRVKLLDGLRGLWPYVRPQRWRLLFAMAVVLVHAAANTSGPYLLGRAVDGAITAGDRSSLLMTILLLLGVYAVSFATDYLQIVTMGKIGQEVLYALRQTLFRKLQELPLSFFHQNASGDLIERINNDTQKINELFSSVLVRLSANLFTVISVGIVIVFLEPQLGAVTWSVFGILLVITLGTSPILQRLNKQFLDANGEYTAEVQEGMQNMKAIIALKKQDYFVDRLSTANTQRYTTAVRANLANGYVNPLYDLATKAAQVGVVIFGIWLVQRGEITPGVVISFLAYATQFFRPLNMLASIWAQIQSSLAGWARVRAILGMESDMHLFDDEQEEDPNAPVISLHDVDFSYDEKNVVLHDVTFDILPQQTLAIIGPTGGGKSTLASLIARLYDPTNGSIRFHGKDIRSYTPQQLSERIGYILQEPVIFTGTVGENIVYGNTNYQTYDADTLLAELDSFGLSTLLTSFPDGLHTPLQPEAEDISVGQRQLIAFMRAILRRPEVLILDEATANIDTITEDKLQHILDQLPETTTTIVIAHRLNTIRDADSILFINGGRTEAAMSFEHALSLLDESNSDS